MMSEHTTVTKTDPTEDHGSTRDSVVTSGYSNDIPTPMNTRANTLLSKESSITLNGDLASREQSFVSFDEKAHIAARLGTLPETSPNAGKPLIDSTGNIRHVSPRNVNVEQYYPTVQISNVTVKQDVGKPGRKKRISVGQLEAVADVPQGQEEINHQPEHQPRSNDKKEITEETAEDCEVFPTQVDEEVLEAAKKRQTGLYDPAWMTRDDYTPSMSELVEGRAEQHFQQGLQHAAVKSFEFAIQCYNKAINLKPKDIRYYVRRAEAYLILSDFQSAILNYKRACVLDPDNNDFYNRLAFVYYFHGQCLFDQKLFPEALEAFARATEMRPDVIGYHTRSIACLAALQRHGECLALVNKRLEIEQDNCDLYIMRARLHQLFRNTTLCYYDIKDALALNPQHPEAKSLMVQLEIKSVELKQQATQLNLVGRHRDALQKISLAIETNPSVAEYHIQRGALHRRLGDFNAAIDDYLLALDKTDHDEESEVYQQSQRQLLLTYNDFAVECFSKRYFEEAIILLNKAIKGEKREKGLYINRGDCFFKEGNLQFSMADYQQAMELDPQDSTIKARIAVLHNEFGVREYQDKNVYEAEKRFTQAIQHNPTMAQYYISRCRTMQTTENSSLASQDILIALLLDPSNLEVMPIVTRLFPGKSIKEVLQSRAAQQARHALEDLIVASVPVVSDSPEDETDPRKAPMSKQPVFAAASLKQFQKGTSDFEICMKEKEFHVRIIEQKQKCNNQVKDALQNRKSLRATVGKIQPLPEPQGYSRRRGNSLQVDQTKTTGWRNFGMGVGVPNGVE